MSLLKRTRPFYSFFFSYIVIFLVPLVISVLLYHEILSVIESSERESTQALLNKVKLELDNDFIEVDRLAVLIGNDLFVRKFALLPGPVKGVALYDIFELVRHLKAYSRNSRFIHSFYLYFRNSDRVITIDSAIESRDFYGIHFTYKDMDFGEWQEVFLKSAHVKDYLSPVTVTIGSTSLKMLTYLRSFPTVYERNPTIVIWILIDEEVIKNYLRNIAAAGGVYIFDEHGKLVTSLSESEAYFEPGNFLTTEREGAIDITANKKKYIVSFTTSSYLGWKYVSVVPYQYVLSKTRAIRLLLIGVGIILILLGLGISYMLALWSTKPLRELVNIISEPKHVKIQHKINEYAFLMTNIHKLLETNRSLHRIMKEQLPMLRTAFFERLFKGEYDSDARIQEALSSLAINIRGSFFMVILIRIGISEGSHFYDRFDSLFTVKAVIKSIIGKKIQNHIHIHDRAENEIVLLISFSAADFDRYREVTEDFLFEIYEELDMKRRIPVVFSAGSAYPNLSEVWHSYRESLEASENIHISNEFGVIWYGEHPDRRSGYYYPVDLEGRLMNNVKSGNRKEVEEILSFIYRENIGNRTLSADILQLFMHVFAVQL